MSLIPHLYSFLNVEGGMDVRNIEPLENVQSCVSESPICECFWLK